MLRVRVGLLKEKEVTEFIMIVEAPADARTATKLAERILVEKVDWLDDDNLQYFFQWSGLQNGTQHSCWTDIDQIINDAIRQKKFKKFPNIRGHYRDGVPFKAYGATSYKFLTLVRLLQKRRNIKAVLLILDLDDQPERREGIEQARLKDSERGDSEQEDSEQVTPLEIVIGTADRKREAWVLNGFIPCNQEEEQILEEIKSELKFHPCIDSHRLREKSKTGPNRIRNPKVVLEKLTGEDIRREQQCWEETSLELLRERGIHTGLTDYIREVEQRLTPIFLSNDDDNTHTPATPES
jgi:hypothetical protein